MKFIYGILSDVGEDETAVLLDALRQRGALYAHGHNLVRRQLPDGAELVVSADRPALIDDLARAYLRSGADALFECLDRAAVAVIEKAARRLHLYRDPSGDHPLFYSRAAGMVAFASMPSGLFPLTGGRPDLDGFGRLRAGDEDTVSTPYLDIRKVRSGELVTIELDGGERRRRHPPIAVQVRSAPWTNADVETARDLLDNAVGSCLPRDGMIAAHASSGRDSTAVAATAARLAPGRLLTFTGAPAPGAKPAFQRHRFADESAVGQAFATALDLPHETVRSEWSLFARVGQLARTFQLPLHPISNLGWMFGIADRARSLGASHMLVGSLGNATLNAGGLYVLQDFWRGAQPARFLSELTAATRRDDVRLRGALAAAFGPWMPSPMMRLLSTRFGDDAQPPRERFVRPEWRRDRREAPDAKGSRRYWRTDYARFVRDVDSGQRRLGMLGGFGLVERAPLADRKLAQFMLQLPAGAFLSAGHYRPFADAVLADRVPDFILNQSRRGLQSADFVDRFSIQEARDVIEDARASHSASSFLDLDALANEIDRVPRLGEFGAGRQMGSAADVLEALTNAIFLTSLDREPDQWGMSPIVMN